MGRQGRRAYASPARRLYGNPRNDVLQFADVARPLVFRQQGDGFWSESCAGSHPSGGFVPESRHEQRNVARAIAKSGHLDTDHIQTKAQIETKPTRGRFLIETTVRGGNDSNIDSARQVFSDSPHFPILQHAQEFGLRACGQLANFVEKQRPAVSVFKQSRPLSYGPGKRASRVAEEFCLDEFVGERSAIQRAESAVAAGSEPVDGTSDEFFAAAALTRKATLVEH